MATLRRWVDVAVRRHRTPSGTFRAYILKSHDLKSHEWWGRDPEHFCLHRVRATSNARAVEKALLAHQYHPELCLKEPQP